MLWHELRFGKIIASNIYEATSDIHEASRCQTPDGSLVHPVIGAAKVYDIYLKRGRRLEEIVVARIEKNFEIKDKKSSLLFHHYLCFTVWNWI